MNQSNLTRKIAIVLSLREVDYSTLPRDVALMLQYYREVFTTMSRKEQNILAGESGDWELITYLLNTEQEDLAAIFGAAVKNGWYNIVKRIWDISLKRHIYLSAQIGWLHLEDNFYELYRVACEKGYLDILKLLTSSPSPYIRPWISTSFVIAATNGHLEIVKYLYTWAEKGEIGQNDVFSAILCAVRENRLEMAIYLSSILSDYDRLRRYLIPGVRAMGFVEMDRFLRSYRA